MDEETYVDILNVFLTYYKRKYNIDNISLLDDIERDDDLDTNEQLEELYEAIEYYNDFYQKHKTTPPIVRKELVDIRNMTNVYGLEIGNELIYISESLFALITYVSTLKWTELNWNIRELDKD